MKKVLFCLFVLFAGSSFAQITIKHSGPLNELLTIIENQYGYKFMYSNDDIDNQQFISLNIQNSDIETVVKEIGKKLNLSFNIQKKQIMLKNNISPKKDITNKSEKPQQTKPPEQSSTSSVTNETLNNSANYKDNTEIQKKDLEISDTLIAYTSKNESVYDTVSIKQEDEISISKQLSDTIKNISENIIKSDATKSDSTTFNDAIETESIVENHNNYLEEEKNKILKININSNLLYDLAVTPNIGFELIYKDKFSAVINGLWMHINWKEGNRCYRIWSIMPEFRYYLQKNNKFYTGLIFNIGQINLMLNETGNQGDFIGGGPIFGYIINIKNKLKLDLGIGLGYINYKYETYNFINETNIKKDFGTKNLWIPVKAGINLVWNIY